tara:strand:- start:5482 stop:6363 length:882 start_codon:yes stop_codon:yes gene_type:complete
MNIDLSDLEYKEKNDPALDDFKHCVKKFAMSAKNLSKSSEGKKLSSEYWSDIVGLIKKSKMAVSMIELGIDDLESFKDKAEPEDLELKKTGPITKSDDSEPTTSDDSSTATDIPKKPEPKPEEEPEEDESDEDEEDVNEEAKSKSQQRLFGMVHAYNKGDLKKSDVDSELYSKIKKIANGMTDKDSKKLAKTNHDDLPEKVPSKEYYDTLNHLSILLSEENFDKIKGTGSGFIIESDKRKFTIEFDQNFYLKSDLYNFDLGDDYDLKEVVDTFKGLIRHSDRILKKEYETLVG